MLSERFTIEDDGSELFEIFFAFLRFAFIIFTNFFV